MVLASWNLPTYLVWSTSWPLASFDSSPNGAVPIVYKEITLDTKYRIDLIVEDAVIVEVKAVEQLLQVHQAQVLTDMRLTGCPAGLLINFNAAKLIDGVKRLINPRR